MKLCQKKISYRNMFATRYRNQTESSGVLNRFELYELKFDFKMVLTPLGLIGRKPFEGRKSLTRLWMFASSPASQSRAGKDTPQNNSGEIKEVVMAEPELSNRALCWAKIKNFLQTNLLVNSHKF